MNRGRLLLYLGGGVTVIIMVALTWYGLTRTPTAVETAKGVSYTDSISGQALTAFPQTGTGSEDGSADTPEPNEVVITGLDDFFATINQDQGRYILDNLTTFIRAHTGARSARAGVLNGKLTKNGSKVSFTLVLVSPSVSYPVTITMPQNDSSTADITYGQGGVAP